MANRYQHIKDKAIALRTEQNMTLDEITECLSVPRTTVYYWIKDIPIPTTQKQTAAQQRRADNHRERHAQKRKAAYDAGMAEAPELFTDPLFRDFVVMYICEGFKRDRNKVSFVNSDPALIRLAHHWMVKFSRQKISYRFQYHVDQDPEEIKRYWAQIVNIDPEQIKFQRKSNSGKLAGRKWRSVHGLLTMETGDTYFRAKLQAWMDFVKMQW